MLLRFTISLFFVVSMIVPAMGGDLYKVRVTSQDDAGRLIATGAEPILVLRDGYLVLTDPEQARRLETGGLEVELIARGVEKDRLALDNRRDEANVKQYPLLYREDEVRLFQVEAGKSLMTGDGSSLIPVRTEHLVIRYRPPLNLNEAAVFQAEDLIELIDGVSEDSVNAQLHHLESYSPRYAGSSANQAARDWLLAKFQAYGYGSARLDAFYAYTTVGWRQCYNVVASKAGTMFPNRQVVVGAHFDAVPVSPGVDDNGTGTVGVLEIARVLADVDTDMSFVFILFDAEETGLNGAWHYAGEAAGNGDSIICMLNMDMIGHITNNYYADIHVGPVDAYARLWSYLGDSLVNIFGYLAGGASNSDHYPFTQYGYDVLFAAEHDFSNVYHTVRDSTSYINFGYCTRMIKATLATAYTVNVSPLPVRIASVRDGGDGQSLQVNWHADDPGSIDHFGIYYDAEPDIPVDSIIASAADTSALITGLVEGREYRIYVLGFNAGGYSSIVFSEAYGTPRVEPAMPQGLTALPRYRAVKLAWRGGNDELDFSHYWIIRDGAELPQLVTDTVYLDNDFSLGADFHSYLVVAVDTDGNISDTVGIEAVSMRAAILEPGRVLAVNRSNRANPYIVDETVTGEFMRDALTGYNYDYLSDTANSTGADTTAVNLVDMLDYEVVILGGEAARVDDFANDPAFGGKLDTIGYYLTIGGKVIMFGRWGDLTTSADYVDTIAFGTTGHNRGYRSFFHMDKRIQYLTQFTATQLTSDLVGAQSQVTGYPDLPWDSLASVHHSFPWIEVAGIPCPTFAVLASSAPEILYTYDSRNNAPLTEGKPVAWRYHGTDFSYVFFEIPLSFFDREAARTALLTAVSELLSMGPAAATVIEPDTLDISEDLPPTVAIYLGNFGDGKTASDVDVSSLLINGSFVPQSVTSVPSHPGFTGDVLEIQVSASDFAGFYGTIIDTVTRIYTVSWQYSGESMLRIVHGQVTLLGLQFVLGDANGDWSVDVADAVYVINYVFRSGPPPQPLVAADANCDGSADVGDAVYIINYVFRNGPPPSCN